MKSTTQKKGKLLQEAYDAYIDLMLGEFPLDRMEEFVVPNVSGYGTTLDEKILDIARLRQLVNDQRDQGAGMEISFTSTPVYRRIEQVKDTAIFVDEFEIRITNKGETDVIPLRLSSVFEYSEGSWKLAHLHGSKAVETESDTWHREEWKKKTEALQLLVEEKTADLEHKNRELEIEAALERVRATALGMKTHDDLIMVAEALLTELKNLGFKNLRNAQVDVLNDQRESYTTYLYSDYGVKGASEVKYTGNPVVEQFVKEIRSSVDALSTLELTGTKLDEWRSYRRRESQLPDPKLEKADAVYFYFYSIGKGAIGISSFSRIDDSQLEILKRFRNVYYLAYQRFSDIQKAEEQAREARIEASLERVRTITMGMRKSDDLLDVCQVISEQLVSLNLTDIRNVQVVIIDELKKVYLNYQYFVPYTHKVYEETEYEHHPTALEMVFELKKSANSFFTGSMKGKALKEFMEWRNKYGQYPDPLLDSAEAAYYYFYSIGSGGLGLTTYREISETSLDIFKRFHKVFTLAYRRFQDIERAQEQAREAQIEAALERVRARSMAMHHTSELQDIINTVHQEFSNLDMDITGGAFIAINAEINDEIACWGAGGTADYVQRVHIPFFDRPIYTGLVKGINKGQGFFSEVYSHEEKTEFFKYIFKHPPYKNAPAKRKKEVLARPGGYSRASVVSEHTTIFIINHHGRKFSDADIEILKRFGNVFEQSYTRFLDLKKAEEQAREAQVELSLERIRAQVTAMSESAELLDIVVTMRTEFVSLGHEAHYFWYMRWLPDKYEKAMTSGDGTRIGMVMSLPRHIHGDIKLVADWEKSDKATLVFPMEVETAVEYVHKMITLGDFKQVDPQAPTLDDIRHIGGLTFVMARTNHGEIGFSLPGYVADPPREDLDTLARFAGVFDLAYRRFEDLKQSELQTRETQIELALERVRARTMAMQESDELAEVVAHLFGQLADLGIKTYRCNLAIVDAVAENCQLWSTTSEGKVIPVGSYVPLTEYSILKKMFEGWKKQKGPVIITISGEERVKWIEYIRSRVPFPEYHPQQVNRDKIRTEPAVFSNLYFKQGMFIVHTVEALPEEHIAIVQRFASVFEQTYTRFLDLQKAENQAREAQIEAALERVRAKSMAMHKSEQLPETAKVLFEQFESLGNVPDRMSIGVIKEDEMEIELWATDQLGTQLNHRFTGSLEESTSIVKVYKAWKEGKDSIVIDLSGQDLKDWIRYIRKDMKMKLDDSNMKGRRVQQAAFFSQGIILYTSNKPVSDDIMHLLVRFAKVFDQAYIRFLDLQKAEAQARDAIKQASLDRIRGQIASMRTTEDLQRITPLIWKELKTLEVPFFRCGVFIVDAEKNRIHVYLTTPDGKALGVLHLSPETNLLTRQTVEHWQAKKVYSEHWEKQDFLDWMKSMVELGQIRPEEYQGGESPPESLNLHFIPFAQGMLYVGNTEPLDEEKIGLVKTLAEAFSIAYARYEDFKNLEEAKNKVELTLNELKAAQAQLIHSEKMASLGELTAGIAHEIQNPLNFVNNFSELSVDLLDEMKEETAAGNTDEVQAIALDLKQNLEKIHHHGQRASSIVKGMLEHSRTGSGRKEPTDINGLADEYLRLAYHGLRAKDKAFNADFKADLDQTLPKVNAVPQDMGRVLLNLINNAFYAVSEKMKKEKQGFTPTVTVSTKKQDETVEIRVKDNGNGIPPEVQEKIFQPFFTTKPTGDGTGLGLSLSYDIITKGHKGDLRVETREGAGTEFIIEIPIK